MRLSRCKSDLLVGCLHFLLAGLTTLCATGCRMATDNPLNQNDNETMENDNSSSNESEVNNDNEDGNPDNNDGGNENGSSSANDNDGGGTNGNRRVNYGLSFTAAGSIGTLGAGEDPPMVDMPLFGPTTGYPSPLQFVSMDLGVVSRGDYVVIDSDVGDVWELLATIDGMRVPTEITMAGALAVEVPFTLEDGEYTLEIRVPSSDSLLARVMFIVEEPILGP